MLILAAFVFALGLYILYRQNIMLPGRYSGNMYTIDYPGYVFIAMSVFSFAITMVLLTFKPGRYMGLSRWLLGLSLVFFSIGFWL